MSNDEKYTPWHGIVFDELIQKKELSEEKLSQLPTYDQVCGLFAATCRPADDTAEGYLKWAGLDWATSKASAKEEA